MLFVKVLGDMQVWVDDRRVAVPRGKQRLLLTALALRRGQAVGADALVELLWEDGSPRSARTTLRGYVKRLRTRLRVAGGRPVIESVAGGYRLSATEDEVDVHRFRRLVREARTLADPRAELAALGSAMRLWRDRPLDGLECARWVEEASSGLTEEWLQALERHSDLLIATHSADTAAVALQSALAAHPLRESLWCKLIQAMHHGGRSAEALLAYEKVRLLLADRLGVAPSGPLRELHQRILSQDEPPTAVPTTGTADSADNADCADTAVRRHEGEAAGSLGLVGRRDHLTALGRIAAQDTGARIVVIDGPAGMGKTALALHWAQRAGRRFPGGHVAVDLCGVHPSAPLTPHEALGALLLGAGVGEDEVPDDPRARVAAFREAVARRPMVVVLDNAHDVGQVRPLLPGPAGFTLVTSQSQLRGLVARDGADRLSVGRLTPEEGHDLVAAIAGPERARADPAAVAELVELCAGLPLALRIAVEKVSRVPRLSLATLVEELRADDTRLDLLETGDDDEASVRTALSRPQRLLRPTEANLLHRLSFTVDREFDLDTAARITGGDTAVLRLVLGRLVLANVLTQPSPHRYHLHDLQRAVARESAFVADAPAQAIPSQSRERRANQPVRLSPAGSAVAG
ncbi:BTAD domain-containing putative transcriptional regulator [Actinosynnema sp. NPDC023587]|uniref:AfsR/SARP family transcriptional regulator n=1 Tax=Actinosynnema sp. NPDC023587 TaxID=3154695 RepID=UPI0033E663A3